MGCFDTYGGNAPVYSNRYVHSCIGRVTMRVYISGPMTGYPDFNYPTFHKVAEEWRMLGHDVFCPAENFNGDQTYSWEFYMKEDLRLVMHCDAIVMLDGWAQSRGALVELITAVSTGLSVFKPNGEEIESSLCKAGHYLWKLGARHEHRNQRENEVGQDHVNGSVDGHHGSDVSGEYGRTIKGSSSDPRVEGEEPGDLARPRSVGVREGSEPIPQSATGTVWKTKPVPYPGNLR